MTFAIRTGLAGLLTAAFLLGACQQSSTGGSGQGLAVQEKTSGSQADWDKRRCCHRAGRTNSR
jgi:hypothetical protein